jgi:hypothetical protein
VAEWFKAPVLKYSHPRIALYFLVFSRTPKSRKSSTFPRGRLG